MAGEATTIAELKRKDELPNGPALPVVNSDRVTLNSLFPKDHWGPNLPPQPLTTVTEAIEYLGRALSTLVLAGTTPTLPTTYTSTKSYTASCGSGTTGSPVTKTATRTSTVSQADADSVALSAATQLATSALVCTPVSTTYTSTQSYTTTPQDYVTKCGSGTSGSSVTRSSTKTSTVSQAQADQLALQDATSQAIAAITCPVTPPSYNTTLPDGAGNQTGDGMSVVPPSTETLSFDLITGTSGPTVSIAITSLRATTYIDYASEYAGKPYVFKNSAGSKFSGVFPSSDNLSITY